MDGFVAEGVVWYRAPAERLRVEPMVELRVERESHLVAATAAQRVWIVGWACSAVTATVAARFGLWAIVVALVVVNVGAAWKVER